MKYGSGESKGILGMQSIWEISSVDLITPTGLIIVQEGIQELTTKILQQVIISLEQLKTTKINPR